MPLISLSTAWMSVVYMPRYAIWLLLSAGVSHRPPSSKRVAPLNTAPACTRSVEGVSASLRTVVMAIYFLLLEDATAHVVRIIGDRGCRNYVCSLTHTLTNEATLGCVGGALIARRMRVSSGR